MFGGQSPLQGGPARLRRGALLRRIERPRDIVVDLPPGVLQIVVLVPRPLTSDDEFSFAIQPLGNKVVEAPTAGRIDSANQVQIHPELYL